MREVNGSDKNSAIEASDPDGDGRLFAEHARHPLARITLNERSGSADHEPKISDDELLARYVCGQDDGAFCKLYARHQQRIFNYSAKMLADTAAAGDIAHHVWERVLELRNSRHNVRHLLGFLYSVARNASLDAIRQRDRSIPLAGVREEEHPAAELAELSHEESLAIQALDRLPQETREIMILHYYSDYTFGEIAEMMSKQPNSIWTRVSRARATMKTYIERELRRHNLL